MKTVKVYFRDEFLGDIQLDDRDRFVTSESLLVLLDDMRRPGQSDKDLFAELPRRLNGHVHVEAD